MREVKSNEPRRLLIRGSSLPLSTLAGLEVGAGGIIAFIGLNPSTADETEDAPTIRRCMSFARDWGAGGILMAEPIRLQGYRSGATQGGGRPPRPG